MLIGISYFIAATWQNTTKTLSSKNVEVQTVKLCVGRVDRCSCLTISGETGLH